MKAALAAGHAVVATGRNTDAVARALGAVKDLLVAGNFYAGFSEEISPADFRAQVETNLFGPMNVTRAMLPVMRGQRRGLIVTISSTGGITGQAFVSACSAAKFGVEGWIESLAPEIAPFGIRTMLVEPRPRTELLTDESTKWPEASIDDYAEKTRETVTAWKKMNGLQGGDPAKLAQALVQLVESRIRVGSCPRTTLSGARRTIVSQVTPPRPSGRPFAARTDTFNFRSVRMQEGVAYAVYFLTFDITDQLGARHREWLESMILRRSGTQWRTALLHSTRVTKPVG